MPGLNRERSFESSFAMSKYSPVWSAWPCDAGTHWSVNHLIKKKVKRNDEKLWNICMHVNRRRHGTVANSCAKLFGNLINGPWWKTRHLRSHTLCMNMYIHTHVCACVWWERLSACVPERKALWKLPQKLLVMSQKVLFPLKHDISSRVLTLRGVE